MRRVGLALVVALALAGAGVGVVYGQTSTPTATATVTPIWVGTPEPTLTPVWPAPDPGWSDVIWWWVLDPSAAPVATWDREVDVTRKTYCGASANCLDYDPGPAAAVTWIALIPPAQSSSITVTCAMAASAFGASHTGGYFSGAAYFWEPDDTTGIDWTLVSGTGGDCVANPYSGGTNCLSSGTWRADLRTYATFPGVDTIPTYELAAGSIPYIQFRLRAVSGTNHTKAQAASSVRINCVVDSFSRFDGSTVVPRVPIVDDFVPIGSTPWAVVTPWTRVVSQTIITGIPQITVGETECIELIPSYGWTTEREILGITVPTWSTPQLEICATEQGFPLAVLGHDLSGLAVLAGIAGVSSSIYFMFKQNG